MRRIRVMVVLAGTAVAWCAAPLAVAAVRTGASVARASAWRTALEVPGLGSLNKGGDATLSSVACTSAGNCAAGGFYRDGSGRAQAFVVTERNGAWGKAREVPGSGAMNAGGAASVNSVSCRQAGNCTAGGVYTDASHRLQAFVVSERIGAWRRALEVPGLGSLNKGGVVVLSSVSCGSAGNCVAAGSYKDGSGHFQAYVVTERNGTWGKARKVPGSGNLNAGGSARVKSVKCSLAGNCAAGGFYTDGSGHFQAFVVTERNGAWGKAREVPGLARLNVGGDATVESLSCGSAGNCAAGGTYAVGSDHFQAFVVSERNGAWGKAIEVPGSARLNAGGSASVQSVSCVSAGNCAGGGFYSDGAARGQAFVVTERNGAWGKAIKVPGSGTLNAGGSAEINSVSCASAGNCAGGGFYLDASGHGQAFVVTERNGVWGKAIEVPGSGTLNAGGNAEVNSVKCPAAGHCAAVGFYTDAAGHVQGFVVRQ